jgi:chromosome segregation ATPase
MQRTAQTLLCLSAVMSLTAQAQIIMCKDASGKTHTADRPIMECTGRAVREFGSNGALKREVPAPLTAEQKRHKQLEEEKRKAEEAALVEQKQADRAILARYRNEDDIEIARKRTLDMIQERFRRQTDTLATAEKQQKEVQAEIAQLKNKKDVSPALHRRSEESDKALRDEKKKFQDYEAEIAQINERYDATLKRYRELNNRQSAAAN